MSVVFINPPSPVRLPRDSFVVRPIGLFSLVATLRSRGIAAEVIDLHRSPSSQSSLVEQIRKGSFQAVGLTCNTYTRFEAISIAELIKNNFPDLPVVAGGPHFSKCAHDALQHLSCIDIVVRGEGESVIRELVPALLGGSDWSNLRGLSFKTGDRIQHNPDAEPTRDLDSLPIFTDFRREDYPEILAVPKERGQLVPAIGMLTSRGCPNRCVFCSVTDGTYRTRSAQSIVDEMEMWIERFPEVRGFNIFDLNFTAKVSHLKEVCEEIISRGLDIRWWAESRLDIDLSLLGLMHEAGCRSLSVGLESGSPRVLRAINKKINVEMICDFATKSESLGIWLDIFIMFSLPSETLDDLKLTLEVIRQLLKRHKKVFVSGGRPVVTSIHPGSPLELIAREKGIIARDFSWHQPYYCPNNLALLCSPYVPIYLEQISRADLERAVWQSNHWITANRIPRMTRLRFAISAILNKEKNLWDIVHAANNRIKARFKWYGS
jgi:anaerobic magnesium-protoporphyrin IX monomethyl ester cyclase